MRTFAANKIPAPPAGTTQWHDLDFGSPIDLEIGAGQGLHSIRYCQCHPERTLVAIERTAKFEKLLARARSHENIKNLVAVRADAINWITHNVPEASIDNIYILYPNPYPKLKHANQHWYSMPFTSFLISRLKPRGRLHLATNIESYALAAAKTLTVDYGMSLLENRILAPNDIPRTHFEKKYLARGERCWNLIFKRQSVSI